MTDQTAIFDLIDALPAPVDVPRRFSKAVQELDPPEPFDRSEWATQKRRVYDVMKCGKRFTLEQIKHHIKVTTGISDPEPSISAQIRHLKNQNGIHHGKERVGGGLTVYWLILPDA
ncbi:hypothetical protein [Zavarzinella formosa]|uniref:hypothetical protein n=1 Tax=Zavarzinella formosa TaxID=360055 RepID=UPI000375F84A|nr:hypothetical protein [Zavarzinella formosa]